MPKLTPELERELERLSQLAAFKPKEAMDAYLALGEQLAAATPHLVPIFFEQAARAFLATGPTAYAAQLFNRARQAEAEHGLPIDEDRLGEVFMEFTLAGVLPVKASVEYVSKLAERVPADQALRRFRQLCVRRTARGLPPSPQLSTELLRLAKAAGADVDAEEQDYLTELLELPATAAAPHGFWKTHRAALIALGRRDPAIRTAYLNMMPSTRDDTVAKLWLEVLEHSGAIAGLGEGDVPARERPVDGTVGWYTRFCAVQPQERLPQLYALVERVAGRLRAELAETGQALPFTPDVDLLDLLLSLEVPVAGPSGHQALWLVEWAHGDHRRDLRALADDPRFRVAFDNGMNRLGPDSITVLPRLMACPGGQIMLTEWVTKTTSREITTRADLAAALAEALRGKLSDTDAIRLSNALAKACHQEDDIPPGPADRLLIAALDGFGFHEWYFDDEDADIVTARDNVVRQIHTIARFAASPPPPAPRLHLEGPPLPHATMNWVALLDRCAAIAYRACSATITGRHASALLEFLRALDTLGLTSTEESTKWRRVAASLQKEHLTNADGSPLPEARPGVLPLVGGAFIAFCFSSQQRDDSTIFTGLFYDPAERFSVPAPYQVCALTPVGETREAGWLRALLAKRAARRAPRRAEAAREFARLTGVTEAVAKLVVAGLPYVDSLHHDFPSDKVRTLEVKVTEASFAGDALRRIAAEVRAEVVGALLPAKPAALWTDGPDVAAAAAVWNAKTGHIAMAPEWLLEEARKATNWHWRWPREKAIPALLSPRQAPELTVDDRWTVQFDHAGPEDRQRPGFHGDLLPQAVKYLVFLAHRLPAGDPLRAALPDALAALRDRLANPDLMINLHYRQINMTEFRRVAGSPTEIGDGWERYGAVVFSTWDKDHAYPILRVSLLDAGADDPYLSMVRTFLGHPLPEELAIRVVRDPRFAALVADPGDPAAGSRNADGTWWPQDPTRSVPDLVTEVAARYGLDRDAATLYLILLAMPDPTDRNVARWTGWKPARRKAAGAQLVAAGLVTEGKRTRAGRTLFLPGGWLPDRDHRRSHFPLPFPLEQWKVPLFDPLLIDTSAPMGAIAPIEPVAALYARSWQRVREGDAPAYDHPGTPAPV